MLNFPKSTIVNRSVAKQKFYDKVHISDKLKTAFQNEIERITWTHKFSPDTLNIKAGTKTLEVEVFEIQLKGLEISDAVLKIIDSAIPYAILFVLKDKTGRQKAVMTYKACENDKPTTERYFATSWQTDLALSIKGNTTDQIMNGFLQQIAPELAVEMDMPTAIEQVHEQEKIQKQIDALTAKIKRELQENKRHELARQRAVLQLRIKN